MSILPIVNQRFDPEDPAFRRIHGDAMSRGSLCHLCPLAMSRRGPVPSSVIPNAILTIVGEAPGDKEVKGRENFTGPSGRILNQALERGGVHRSECSAINTVACQPPVDYNVYISQLKADHAEKEYLYSIGKLTAHPGKLILPEEACRPRFARDVIESNSKVILAVGNHALKSVAAFAGIPFGKRKKGQGTLPLAKTIKDQHGAPITLPDGRIICSSIHPASAMRPAGRAFMPVIKADLTRAAMIARRGYVDWKPPETILFPSVEQIEETCARIIAGRSHVVVDIETNGKDPRKCKIRCIGLGSIVDGREVVIVVPIRFKKSHETWWPNVEERRRVFAAVKEVLDRCEIVGHNVVNFDSTVLLRHGLISSRTKRYLDTMIAAKDSDLCELPKRLDFVTTRFLESPSWKISHDDKFDKDNGTGSDEELHVYCGYDVANTLRIFYRLRDRMAELSSLNQFKIDMELAPIFRDMGLLGLCIDTRRRYNLAVILQAEVTQRSQALREILTNPKYFDGGVVPPELLDFAASGPPRRKVKGKVKPKPFNPNTPAHIAHFLFKLKGLVPIINAKGHNWKKGDKLTTGAGSLTRLLASGVDRHTEDFLDALFIYRAYEKLSSTYVGRIAQKDIKKKGRIIKKGELYGGFPMEEVDCGSYGKLHFLFTSYNLAQIASGRVSTKPACFDDRTEILTVEGWKFFKDLQPSDRVAQYWWDSETIDFVQPLDVVDYFYRGKMTHLSGEAIDLLVTPDHRFTFRTRHGGKRQVEAWQLPLSKDYELPSWQVDKQHSTWNSSHYQINHDVDYKGHVYCVTVPSDMIVVRRNGKVSITNNCQNWLERGRAAICYDCLGDPAMGPMVKHCRKCEKEAKEKDPTFTDLITHCITCHGKLCEECKGTGHFKDKVKKCYDPSKACLICHADGKSRAPLNMRAMVMAPPGHTFVNADFDQLELRIYAAVANDRLVLDVLAGGVCWKCDGAEISCDVCKNTRFAKKDVHLWNYCNLEGKTLEDAERIYRELEAIGGKNNKKVKSYRNIAKRFCIAEGQLVLTDHGLVPIEKVEKHHRLWDGLEWVTHDGVVFQGIKEVVSYDGLIATPDHEVWTEDGEKCQFREVYSQGKHVAKSGNGRDPLRFEGQVPSQSSGLVARSLGKKKVYDILNAGPRRRFTVSNCLVSNCFLMIYKGEKEKLHSVMAAERDKATGERSFPDISDNKESRDKIARWFDNWVRLHPEMQVWQKKMMSNAEVFGFVSSYLDGRKRFFVGGAAKEAAPVNHPIQSTGADCANRSIVKLAELIGYRVWSELSGLVLQVHDAITAVVPDNRVEEAVKIFEEVMYFLINGVPITASATTGKYWSDL